ncbi:MAG: hypothetical protein HY680_10740 [Chloroflexi bacterium]|nr:hypothetical protein [Chloroflexota bacterium]
MEKFTADYLLLSFLSSWGVLLLVTARERLSGLLLLGPRLSQLAGVFLVVGTMIWFFASKPRNIPDTLAGLDGNQQAMLFLGGTAGALALLLLLSSLKNWSMAVGMPVQGMEALRHASYLRLVVGKLRLRWSFGKTRTKAPFSG